MILGRTTNNVGKTNLHPHPSHSLLIKRNTTVEKKQHDQQHHFIEGHSNKNERNNEDSVNSGDCPLKTLKRNSSYCLNTRQILKRQSRSRFSGSRQKCFPLTSSWKLHIEMKMLWVLYSGARIEEKNTHGFINPTVSVITGSTSTAI